MAAVEIRQDNTKQMPKAVVIGASAGALEALSQLLPTLPGGFPLPIMVVVHLPADKRSVFAELLHARCAVDVREAEDKEALQPATVYFAPPDYHLLVESNGSLSLSSDEPVLYSRPSIDVLFESAAEVYGPRLIGIILTGANSDGAAGARAIGAAGGTILVQNPATAFSSAMPEAAIEAFSGAEVLLLDEISSYLIRAVAA